MFMALPEGMWPEKGGTAGSGPKQNGARLVAEAGADRYALAANGTTAAQNGGAALGLHARAETMSLHAAMAIRLKCALGHGNALLFDQ